MAYYLVSARPRRELLDELAGHLQRGTFFGLRPFGKELTRSLRRARRGHDGRAWWEEEDYCTPPLAEERAAVLDDYFDVLQVQRVEQGEGWRQIQDMPLLFPDLVRPHAADG